MDVVVDLGMCQGYGNCVAAAPDFFDLDDSGQVLLLKGTAKTEAEQAAVRDAIPVCPMSAIRLGE
ncbi:ferredoxin [Amycolatopsis rhabdoformis]|uniref:Ferredoxin n=1 Tax=Amycolatopsis rhabdoformis TaxID=1448059 RepID=A0ABZ1IHC2_9PSEU|nr:ferredoxin [Amycolatopsis rhabdoformis]WSE33553.1 ferredoxin [Amycolatopsis rhabdoformis]